MGAGLAALPTIGVQAAPAAKADTNGVAAMADRASGEVAVTREGATHKVGFIRVKGDGDLMPALEGRSADAATAKADAYLDEFAGSFGARADELQRAGVDRSPNGWTITYTQTYQGVDVFGSMLRAQVDQQGDLTSVNGFAAPDLSLSTDPRVSATKAASNAEGLVEAQPPVNDDGSFDVGELQASDPRLVVYRKGSTKGEDGESVLAWYTEVGNGDNIRDVVILDASTGKPVNRWSLVHGALDRHLIEAGGSNNPSTFTEVWKEGDPFPGTLNQDQQNEVNFTGDSYWFFKNVFNRDSYDGAGHSMTTVNNDGRISCPNANWNGTTTNYCDGVTSDDVVAHEWGHAYTEYTHGLIYQWQAGALNESYSDVWGETIDLINGRLDDGEGDLTTKRTDGICATEGPRAVQVVINSPANIAKVCVAGSANWGATPTTTGVTNQVVLGLDAANTDGPATNDGCTALTNAAAVNGKIGMVQRGTCPFTTKAQNLVNAGAVGVILYNNNGGGPFGPGGGVNPPLTVPVVGISQADGERILSIPSTTAVNATIRLSGTDQTDDSYRWLMGEKSSAFGGAIRDMWMPTCAGDPGKVSDAEYHCDTSDAGGVHTNSGVPNHGYALLVDGGTSNGVTITGIGLDKAAAIYYRAMTAYQTPTSDFTDHADALAASCRDLTGQPINKLTVAPNATPVAATPITATDCTQVDNAAAAVELRKEPTQCNFKPLFEQGAPAPCGPGYTTDVLWSEDFEDGLAGWGTDQEVVYDGGFGKPWTTVTGAEGHAGRVAFGNADGRLGKCVGGAGDFSSRDSIISPIVELPSGTLRNQRLSFEHSVATELDVDGGNVKVAVNGGDFEAIPAEAYTFNAPGTLLPASAGNTNPLAGEDAFTGTDGGELTTAWGTSVVDMGALGVVAGDTVQFRLDIGRDGCGGVTGWWVDNIALTICKLATKVTAVHVPEPSTFGEASTARVTVARDGSTGSTPTGEVVITKADGTEVGSAELVDGKASVPLPADLPVGANKLTATYSGSDSLATSTAAFTATVVGKGVTASTTTAKVKPAKPRFKRDFKVVVKVAAEGTTPTGRVVVRIDGKKIGAKRLDDGRVVLTVTKNLEVGKHKLVARYTGSDSVEDSSDKLTFKVVRR
ncbi:M4 family metallopeptidase [Nocardioides cavernae]|uniref:M4 family metallopeptidase n=1 Tax=Nocardioides cavernae TaxID=1921566 RepID=A0ABR8NDT6_9ACTN|nr:M4 family metallopeptidase [Nocardioides cavernae]MBD3926050.1 M4 family metallopeptidase [Nocardioides cavernae]MBM7513638.1 Zn-dependent metalloprotease [Nocardioides cavernae]